MNQPVALYADQKGEIYDAPGYFAVGNRGREFVRLTADDLIPLPQGTDLMFLPGCSALASQGEAIAPIASSLLAVSAALPVGYTRTLFARLSKTAGRAFAAALRLCRGGHV